MSFSYRENFDWYLIKPPQDFRLMRRFFSKQSRERLQYKPSKAFFKYVTNLINEFKSQETGEEDLYLLERRIWMQVRRAMTRSSLTFLCMTSCTSDTTSHCEALFFVCLFAHSFVFLACSIARKPVLDG